MFSFYLNAIKHSKTQAQKLQVILCFSHCVSIDNDEFMALIKECKGGEV